MLSYWTRGYLHVDRDTFEVPYETVRVDALKAGDFIVGFGPASRERFVGDRRQHALLDLAECVAAQRTTFDWVEFKHHFNTFRMRPLRVDFALPPGSQVDRIARKLGLEILKSVAQQIVREEKERAAFRRALWHNKLEDTPSAVAAAPSISVVERPVVIQEQYGEEFE